MSIQIKLIFCTYPSFYSGIVLDLLVSSPHIEVVAVISSTRNLKVKENKLLSDLIRIKHSGIRYAFYLWLVSSGYCLLGTFLRLKTLSNITQRHDIPVYKTNNINKKSTADIIKSLQPDVLLCAHFNQRVNPSIYSIASKAAVNIHPSLLPDLKGVDPAFYALLDGYNETGVTLHELNEDFDEGRKLAQSHYKILQSDTLLSLNQVLFRLGAQLFIDNIKHKTLQNSVREDTNAQPRYDSWPTRKQVTDMTIRRRLFSLHDVKRLFERE